MSNVTSIILTMHCGELGFSPANGQPTLKSLNRWLDAHGHPQGLVDLTPYFAGSKHPQTYTFGAAFNYFPLDGFLVPVAALRWEFPEHVVMVIQTEHDEATKVWRPE